MTKGPCQQQSTTFKYILACTKTIYDTASKLEKFDHKRA